MNTPIRRQLMTMLMVTSVLVVVVTTASYLAYEVLTYRQTARQELSTLARVVASNSTAALAFTNADDAAETLGALRADPRVVSATLYDADGRAFASYPDDAAARDGALEPDGYRIEGGRLVGYQPVVEGDRRLGTLYVVSDMAALYDRLRLYAGIAAIVMAGALLSAYLLARRLQHQISQPILALAEVAEAVSTRRDYSARAAQAGRGELSTLTHAFNHMLDRIAAQHGEVERSAVALRESEQSLATTLDSIADAVIAVDTEGRVLRINPVAEQLTGWAANDAAGRPIAEVFRIAREEGGAPAEDPVARVLREGEVVAFTDATVLTARDGGVRPVAHTGSPMRDGGGALRGVVLVFRDQTEERRAQQTLMKSLQLEAQNLHMQEANRLKSEFLANMSHELRTPLNGILGFAEILHDERVGAVTPTQKEFLGDILNSGQHLLQLINDVLDLSKVEAGKLDFRPEPIELGKVVKEVLAVLRTTVASKGILVSTEVDPSLVGLELDPSRFKQVLYNYVSNALKFTPEGGRVVVRAKPDADGACFRVEVEDSGIGISPEDIDRLFVEFQQLDAGAAKRHGGTGLGLALTKRLVEAQGGSVGLRSTVGVGSVFYAILPRRALGGKRVQDVRVRASATHAGPTVLVIEDDDRDRALLVKTLTEGGFDVETASTGAQAIAACRRERFQAVTLDLLLPDMGGLDVLREIRAQGPNRDVPVVVVTVVAEEGAVAGFVVHDLLAKPLDGAALLGTLTRAGVSPDRSGSILVVDDDAASLKLMDTTLTQFGFRATCALSGEQGLVLARQSPPTAIVLDLMMPEMDGFEFLARLRQTPGCESVPVIVWTVKDLTAEEHARLGRSAHRVVAKGGPQSSGTVVGAMRALLKPTERAAPRGAPSAGETHVG